MFGCLKCDSILTVFQSAYLKGYPLSDDGTGSPISRMSGYLQTNSAVIQDLAALSAAPDGPESGAQAIFGHHRCVQGHFNISAAGNGAQVHSLTIVST